MSNFIYVCNTCGADDSPPSGVDFAAHLNNACVPNVEVRLVSCLNMCDRPLAMALRATGKVAYLFAGVHPEKDVEDTLALMKLYRDATDGIIEDARPAGRVRFCLKGRIPAL